MRRFHMMYAKLISGSNSVFYLYYGYMTMSSMRRFGENKCQFLLLPKKEEE